MSKKGKIFVISGPSGVGKGTVCTALLEQLAGFALSTSATSRPMRSGETDGIDYHFKSREAFQAMIDGGELIEWAEYNGNLYGTPAFAVREKLEAGQNVLLEIEVQGALIVREKFPDACLIFIEPPSMTALEKRLRNRGTNDEDDIRNRLVIADGEIGRKGEFDYAIINDNLDICVSRVRQVIELWHDK